MKHFALIQTDEPLSPRRSLLASSGKRRGTEPAPAYPQQHRDRERVGRVPCDPRGTESVMNSADPSLDTTPHNTRLPLQPRHDSVQTHAGDPLISPIPWEQGHPQGSAHGVPA